MNFRKAAIVLTTIALLSLTACSSDEAKMPEVNAFNVPLSTDEFQVSYPDFMEETTDNIASPNDKSVYTEEGFVLDAGIRVSVVNHGNPIKSQDLTINSYGFETKDIYLSAGYEFSEEKDIVVDGKKLKHFVAKNKENREDWYWHQPKPGVSYEVTTFVRDNKDTPEFEPDSITAAEIRRLVVSSFKLEKIDRS